MHDFELADDFLPIYDVSDAVATVADADRETAWRGLLDVDLLKLGREAPVVGVLGALRMLPEGVGHLLDWKSTRLNSSHAHISYGVFCLKKKNTHAGTSDTSA